jgi:O-antigen/teichoic acid export membrane protein
MFVTALQGIFLIVIERRNAVLKATAAGAVSNLLLDLLLIPRWSMHGAAVATVISQFVVFLYCTRSISSILPLRYFVTGTKGYIERDIMTHSIDEKNENLSSH